MNIYYTDKYTGGRGESHRLLEKAFAVNTGDEERAKALIGAMKKGEHGKPYIDGFSCFSISHTGSIWAVLIADRECGLDIQLGRKCSYKAIAERWFAPEDVNELCGKSGYDEPESGSIDETARISEAFFCIWARREALTKALGGTVYDPGLPAVLPGHAEVNGKCYSISDIELPAESRLYAAICVEGSSPISISEIRDLGKV